MTYPKQLNLSDQNTPQFPEPEWFTGRWEKVSHKLPPSGEPVLLAYRYSGRWYKVRAQYAAKFTLVGHPDVDTDWCDYSEELDEYFCPEGWYETNAFEEINWRVSGTPVYWAYLPALPQDAVEQTQGDVVPSASGFKPGCY